MFSVDLIDDLFSEGGLEKVLGELIKDLVKGNLIDVFFNALPYLIVFFIVYSVFKGVLVGIFKNLGGAGGSVVDSSSGLLGSIYDFMFNGAPQEGATDKAQRLLGDGRYKEVAKFLRGYIKSNPEDAHAQALYDIAIEYSNNRSKSTYGNYGAPAAVKYSDVKRQDNNANYDSYDRDDSYNTPIRARSSRKIAELGSDLVKAASGRKLTKEQMIHFAKTGKLPGQ